MAFLDCMPIHWARAIGSYRNQYCSTLDSANHGIDPLLFEPVVGGIIGWLWEGEITLGFWTLLGGGPLMLAEQSW